MLSTKPDLPTTHLALSCAVRQFNPGDLLAVLPNMGEYRIRGNLVITSEVFSQKKKRPHWCFLEDALLHTEFQRARVGPGRQPEPTKLSEETGLRKDCDGGGSPSIRSGEEPNSSLVVRLQ
jgi:hypothetical protein